MNKSNHVMDARTYLILRFLANKKRATAYKVYSYLKETYGIKGKNVSPGASYNYIHMLIKNNLLRVCSGELSEKNENNNAELQLTDKGKTFYDENIKKFLKKSSEFPRDTLLECLVILQGDLKNQKAFGDMIKLNLIEEENTKTESTDILEKTEHAFVTEWIRLQKEASWQIATKLGRPNIGN
ncbi:MAG: hypothetical protein OEZ22_13075 [Spirochaetia bacterium]|nr:hypothetical protein [Spirochaetia bacterium]